MVSTFIQKSYFLKRQSNIIGTLYLLDDSFRKNSRCYFRILLQELFKKYFQRFVQLFFK